MHSDKQLYEIFEVNPQWLFELTGRTSPGPCKFVSITLKAIERRSDGLLLPELASMLSPSLNSRCTSMATFTNAP